MELISNAISWLWSNVFVFLLVLTFVVFIHELGHFLVARWCGVAVKAFSIGFGPEIAGRTDKYGTRWRVAWIPLGGYVKFLDDENAASKPSPETLRKMTPEQRKGSFHMKPLWQRAAVVAAGPIANFLLAALLYSGLNAVYGVRSVPATVDAVVAGTPAAAAGFRQGDTVIEVDGTAVGSMDEVQNLMDLAGARPMVFTVDRNGERLTLKAEPVVNEQEGLFGRTFRRADLGIRSLLPPRVGDVHPGLPAQKAGIQVGDLVTAVNGTPVTAFEDIRALIKDAQTPVTITVERGGKSIDFQLVPVIKALKDEAGKTIERPIIGITRASPEPKPVSLATAVRLGVHETYQTIANTISGLNAIIAGRQSADQMGGPLLMAEVTAKAAEAGHETLLRWIALISANIGFLNLLPIPILDGGHLMFYAIEAVRRRPLSERVQQFGFQIGLAIIVGLMILVNFNDLAINIRRLFGAS